MKIPFYKDGIKNSYCDGYIDMDRFILANKRPKKQQSDLLKQINQASLDGDKELKVQLKNKLIFYTPSIVIPLGERRRYDNIEEFNGVAQLDFDGLDLDSAVDFKAFIFDNYKELYCAYLSPSKKGVKALIRIPVVKNVQEYQDYYRAIEEEFEIYNGFDPAPKNAVLPLFLSEDVFIRYREEPEVWRIKKHEEVDLREVFPIPRKPYRALKSNEKNKARAINTVRKAINSIVSSPGHYQLRSACLIFGTRVGYGYVDHSEAIAEVEALVKANHYLSKGVSGYLKTAHWGVEEGIKTPKGY